MVKRKNFGKLSRKEQRKKDRTNKKQKRHEFYVNRNKNQVKTAALDQQNPQNIPKKKRARRKNIINAEKPVGQSNTSLLDETLNERKLEEKEAEKLAKEITKKRRERLKSEAAADDVEIKRLEKRLGLRKRSEKAKSNFFAADGLDYILDFCDTKKEPSEGKTNIYESEDDFSDDFAQVTGKSKKRSAKKGEEPKKKKHKPNLSVEDEDSSGSEPEEFLSSKAGSNQKITRRNHETSDADGGKSDTSEQDSDLSDGDMDSSESSDEEKVSVKKQLKERPRKKSESSSISRKPLKTDFNDSEGSGSEESDVIEQPKAKKLKKSLSKKSESTSLSRKSPVKPHFNDSGGSDEEERSIMQQLKAQKQAKNTSKSKMSVENSNEEVDFSGDSFDDSDDDASEGEGGIKVKSDGTWEDIYGRTRDKQGNVVVVAKYQPPHLRQITNVEENEKLNRLKRQMKGLLNRLAENNMASISSEVESLYNQHSRNEMSETMWSLYQDSLIAETDTPVRLVAEHALLLAILSANIGSEVAAHCLQRTVALWHQLWTNHPAVPDKRTNNLLLLLSFMCHLKLFHCSLLYDILNELVKNVQEKEVELVLLVLRTVGFSLRKEDPAKLKEFVLKTQAIANDTAADSGSRSKFLLDTVLAIKNNNVSKIPNYNPEYGEQLKKILRACVRKGNYTAELKISLEDLLKADERGRWWVVGSAWTGELPGEKPPEDSTRKKENKSEGFSEKLLELARKQRMNTDARRSVFCVMMSAEDYLDAFEKLVKLRLQGANEREVMNVMLHCLLQEKSYNPYYEHLAKRFCQANRRFQIMLQFATWDKIQDLGSLSTSQVGNLSKFLGHLIIHKSLAISVLKVVELGGLDKSSMRFMRQVLLTILLSDSDEDVLAVFARVAGSKPLRTFKESLRLFLHHFVLRNSKQTGSTDMELLSTRVKLADQALSAGERGTAF